MVCMGVYKKANKMGRVPKKGGLHKKRKKRNFQKNVFSKLIRYYYTEFIYTF